MADIKSMGLYRNVDRVLADLEASGFGPDSPLTVDDLTPYDQYHYEGTDAVVMTPSPSSPPVRSRPFSMLVPGLAGQRGTSPIVRGHRWLRSSCRPI